MSIGIALPPLFRRSIRCGWCMLRYGQSTGMTFTALFAIMLLLQLLVLAFLGVRGVHMLLVQRAPLQVELLPQTSDHDMQQLYGALRAMPSVRSITYVPQEKAGAFSLILPSPRHFDIIRQALAAPQWSPIIHPSFLADMRDTQTRLRSQLLMVRGVELFAGFLSLVGLSMLFAVLTALVRRGTWKRREEVELEELLGASRFDTVLPVATGITLSLLPVSLLATLLVLCGYVLLPFAPEALSEGPSLLLRREVHALLLTIGPVIFLFEMLLMPVMATAGAWVGMRCMKEG